MSEPRRPSARLAQKSGASEKIILACLLHDIAIAGFVRSDHGYWGTQPLEPYVDEEVSWAIRYHQALRFFAGESVGDRYPDMYVKLFGRTTSPSPTSSGRTGRRASPSGT